MNQKKILALCVTAARSCSMRSIASADSQDTPAANAAERRMKRGKLI